MKQTAKKVLVVLMVLCLMATFAVGCRKGGKGSIVGKWVMDPASAAEEMDIPSGVDLIMEFTKDNKVLMKAEAAKGVDEETTSMVELFNGIFGMMELSYEILDEETMKLELPDSGEEPVEAKYKLEGNRLEIIEQESGEKLVLTRR